MLAIRPIVHHHRLPVRALAAVALAAAVIVGLLAMHVLGSGTADHHTPAASTSVAATASDTAPAPGPQHDEAPSAAQADPAHPGTAQAAPCVDCAAPMAPMPAQDHSMLMMACVLALLIGLLLIAAPVLTGVLAVVARTADTGLRFARRGVARARAPSLLVLSISRT